MKKLWSNRPPNKGDVVEFVLKDNRVVGYYCGFDDDCYEISQAFRMNNKVLKAYVKKDNVERAQVLASRGSLK